MKRTFWTLPDVCRPSNLIIELSRICCLIALALYLASGL